MGRWGQSRERERSPLLLIVSMAALVALNLPHWRADAGTESAGAPSKAASIPWSGLPPALASPPSDSPRSSSSHGHPTPDLGSSASTGRYRVNSTTVLRTGQVLPGNPGNVPNVDIPVALAFDSRTGQLFGVGYNSNSVGVFDTNNRSLVRSVHVAGFPYGIGIDPARGEVYVGSSATGTVSILSDVDLSVIATVAVGESPEGFAADAATGQMFVTNINSGNVSAISETSHTVVANIAVGAFPQSIACDERSGKVFVGNAGSSNLSVISASNDTLVGTIPLVDQPTSVTVDPSAGEVWVTLSSRAAVEVLSESTSQVIASVPVGPGPDGAVLDTGRGELYVSNAGSGNVSVVNVSSRMAVASIALVPPPYAYPAAMAYDPGAGEVWVVLEGSDLFVVISDATHTQVGKVNAGTQPAYLAVATESGQLFASDLSGSNLTAVDLRTGAVAARIPVGGLSGALAYDSGRREIFAASEVNSSLVVVDESTDRVIANVPTAGIVGTVLYDSARSEIWYQVANTANLTAISDTNYSVVANFSGPWNVNAMVEDPVRGEVYISDWYQYVYIFSDLTHQPVANVSIGPYGIWGLAYDAARGEMFVSSSAFSSPVGPTSPEISVISDSSRTVIATIPVTDVATGLAYDSGTGEILVSTPWNNTVLAISAATDQITSGVAVGDGPAAIVYDALTDIAYVASVASGTLGQLMENLTPLSVTVDLGVGPAACGPVAFAGAPRSDGDALSVVPGTYPVSVGSCPGYRFQGWSVTGGLGVSDARALATEVVVQEAGSLVATFSALSTPTYPVDFVASGLPPGQPWMVALGAETNTSITSDVGFLATNGTYAFQLGPVDGYLAQPASGQVTIDGAGVVEELTFSAVPSPPRFAVVFAEAGLPQGTVWSVVLNLTPVGSAGNAIEFLETNGTYAYVVSTVNGFLAIPTTGTVSVSGETVVVAISWSAVSPAGLRTVPPDWGQTAVLYGVLAGAVGVAAVAVLLAWRRRRLP